MRQLGEWPTGANATGAPELGTPPPLERTATSAAMKILLAEDNIINQKVAVRMFERLGHRVDVVANGLEAVEALSRIPYDLVFMDCQMPEMDGSVSYTHLRAHETVLDLVCRLLLDKKQQPIINHE